MSSPGIKIVTTSITQGQESRPSCSCGGMFCTSCTQPSSTLTHPCGVYFHTHFPSAFKTELDKSESRDKIQGWMTPLMVGKFNELFLNQMTSNITMQTMIQQAADKAKTIHDTSLSTYQASIHHHVNASEKQVKDKITDMMDDTKVMNEIRDHLNTTYQVKHKTFAEDMARKRTQELIDNKAASDSLEKNLNDRLDQLQSKRTWELVGTSIASIGLCFLLQMLSGGSSGRNLK